MKRMNEEKERQKSRNSFDAEKDNFSLNGS